MNDHGRDHVNGHELMDRLACIEDEGVRIVDTIAVAAMSMRATVTCRRLSSRTTTIADESEQSWCDLLSCCLFGKIYFDIHHSITTIVFCDHFGTISNVILVKRTEPIYDTGMRPIINKYKYFILRRFGSAKN